MTYNLLIRPLLTLLVALIGRERAERWVDHATIPFFLVITPIATVAVTIWALS
jgi:hypothetical protein